MWSFGRLLQFFGGAAIFVCVCAEPAFAQENQQPTPQGDAQTQPQGDAQTPKPPQPYGGGTPIDVLLNTRFWTDVPEAKDFVKASRPPEDSLDYQPTSGKDPVRPKPRTPAELRAMEDELERAGAAAERAAGVKKRNFHVEAKKTLSAASKPIDRSDLPSQ